MQVSCNYSILTSVSVSKQYASFIYSVLSFLLPDYILDYSTFNVFHKYTQHSVKGSRIVKEHILENQINRNWLTNYIYLNK